MRERALKRDGNSFPSVCVCVCVCVTSILACKKYSAN